METVANLDHQDLLDLPVLLVNLAHKALLDHVAFLVSQEVLVQPVPQVLLVHLDQQANQDRSDHLDHLGLLAPVETVERLDLVDQLVLLAQLDLLDPPVLLGDLGHVVNLDLVVQQVCVLPIFDTYLVVLNVLIIMYPYCVLHLT